MSAEWKDTTGYSRDDKVRAPTTWSLEAGDIRITVTCGHIYHKGSWVMHCSPWFNTYPLPIDNCAVAAEAQHTALLLVRKRFTALMNDLSSIAAE